MLTVSLREKHSKALPHPWGSVLIPAMETITVDDCSIRSFEWYFKFCKILTVETILALAHSCWQE